MPLAASKGDLAPGGELRGAFEAAPFLLAEAVAVALAAFFLARFSAVRATPVLLPLLFTLLGVLPFASGLLLLLVLFADTVDVHDLLSS